MASESNTAQIEHTIATAQPETLRAILRALAAAQICREEMTKVMLVPETEAKLTLAAVAEAGAGAEEEEEGPAAKKQKRDEGAVEGEVLVERWRRCVLCGKDFDVTRNEADACRRHNGEREMDEDAFPDDDEIREWGENALAEDDWRIKEFPESFTWNCCDGNADSEPCCITWHSIVEVQEDDE